MNSWFRKLIYAVAILTVTLPAPVHGKTTPKTARAKWRASACVMESARAARYWKTWEDEFQTQALKDIKRDIAFYLEAKRAGNPIIEALEYLGFRFEAGNEAVPTLEEAFRRYERKMQSWVKKGVITENEILLPRRVFSNLRGLHLFLRPGDPILRDIYAVTDLLPDAAFVDMLAHGFFPAGEIQYNVNGNRHVALMHDFFHLAGFMVNPEYMAAVRRAFVDLKERKATFGTNTAIATRLTHATESLALVPPEKKDGLSSLLNLPQKPPGTSEFYTAREIYHFLNKMPAGERESYLKKVYAEFDRHIHRLGGAAADIIIQKVFPAGDVKEESSPFIDQSLVDLARRSTLLTEVQSPEALMAHARFIAALDGASKITPEEWVTEALKERVDPTSKLFTYICKTGIWTRAHGVYQAHAAAMAQQDIQSDIYRIPLTSLKKFKLRGKRYLKDHPEKLRYLSDPDLILTLTPQDAPLIEALLVTGDRYVTQKIAELFRKKDGFSSQYQILNLMLMLPGSWEHVLPILSKSEWAKHPAGISILVDALRVAVSRNNTRVSESLLKNSILANSDWASHIKIRLIQEWALYLSRRY